MPKIGEWQYNEDTGEYGFVYSEREYTELSNQSLFVDEETGIVVADWKKYEAHLKKEAARESGVDVNPDSK